MGKELFHQPFLIGQGDQAVPQIAGSDDIQILPYAARRAAVVGYSNDGRQIIRLGLQPSQHDRQPRAAADDDDLRPLGQLQISQD